MKNNRMWAMVLFSVGLTQVSWSKSIDWQKLTQTWKSAVVNVQLSAPIGLNKDIAETGDATGFVVDAQRGWIATNQHVVGESPTSSLRIRFAGGDSIPGKVIYYDPWHDFSFIEYSPKDLNFTPKEVIFESMAHLAEGQEVCLVGNSSGQEFSVKTGLINRLFVNETPNDLARYSHHIHLSLARAGGASGSPIFTEQGKVLGIHSSGEDNESFELRADYIREALEQLRQDKLPKRGDTFARLYVESMSLAKRFFKFPSDRYASKIRDSIYLQHVLVVGRVVSETATAKILRPGDIILAVKFPKETLWNFIGADIYRFDYFVDQQTGHAIDILVFRDQKEVHVTVPVADTEKGKIKRFALFGGGVFHDVTPSMAMNFDVSTKGIFLSESDRGSPLDMGGRMKDKQNKRKLIIHRIDQREMNSLDDFIDYAKSVTSEQSNVFWVTDFLEDDYLKAWYYKDVNPVFQPLKVFSWNTFSRDWVEEKN